MLREAGLRPAPRPGPFTRPKRKTVHLNGAAPDPGFPLQSVIPSRRL